MRYGHRATFGAGCFWGVQAAFDKLNGVIETIVGYMGGATKDPTYEQVCTNITGHAEVVQIKYDPKLISYETLLDSFFEMHYPTQNNGQGHDIGSRYRSVIFYHDVKQKNLAEKVILTINESHRYQKELVTKVIHASIFYKAEEYHQHYFEKNGDFGCGIS